MIIFCVNIDPIDSMHYDNLRLKKYYKFSNENIMKKLLFYIYKYKSVLFNMQKEVKIWILNLNC
jgi:hypothetical protein